MGFWEEFLRPRRRRPDLPSVENDIMASVTVNLLAGMTVGDAHNDVIEAILGGTAIATILGRAEQPNAALMCVAFARSKRISIDEAAVRLLTTTGITKMGSHFDVILAELEVDRTEFYREYEKAVERYVETIKETIPRLKDLTARLEMAATVVRNYLNPQSDFDAGP